MSKRAAALLRGLWAGSRVAAPIWGGSHQSSLKQLRHLANNAAAAQAPAAEKEAWKPSPVSLVLFVPSIVCGYLSYWQYERSRWKAGLIEDRKQSLEGPAQDIYDMEELRTHAKVSCSGRFIHERSLFVGPRPRSVPGAGIQSGYFLVTPLYNPDRKGAVLVNRGWVPASWLNDITRISTAPDAQPPPTPEPSASPSSTSQQQQAAAIETAAQLDNSASSTSGRRGLFGFGSFKSSNTGSKGSSPSSAKQADTAGPPPAPIVTVTGVIQESEKPSAVLPDNDPEGLDFRWIEVPAMAHAVGLPPDTPLVQVLSDDPATLVHHTKQNPVTQARHSALAPVPGVPQFPIPKNTADLVQFATMPKDHLVYAGIWTTLCITLGLMARQAVFFPPKVIRMVGGNPNKQLWAAVQSGTEGKGAT